MDYPVGCCLSGLKSGTVCHENQLELTTNATSSCTDGPTLSLLSSSSIVTHFTVRFVIILPSTLRLKILRYLFDVSILVAANWYMQYQENSVSSFSPRVPKCESRISRNH